MLDTEKKVVVIPAKYASEISRTKRLNVAAYCRVSTDKEEQETSYEAQISYCTEKINGNPEWNMAGIFADEGITGTQAKKPPGIPEHDSAVPQGENRHHSYQVPVPIRPEYCGQPELHTRAEAAEYRGHLRKREHKHADRRERNVDNHHELLCTGGIGIYQQECFLGNPSGLQERQRANAL